MITLKKTTKAGLVLINYRHAILDQEIQNNGGCPEVAGPDRERFLQPRKYQKYPHRSWLGNWLRALIVKIQGYCTGSIYRNYSLDTWCLTEQTHVLRSDTTSNRINHTACQIWPKMLHISCALMNSSTLKTSSTHVFQQTRGPQNFSKPFKKHHIYYWVFRFIFHSWFIWFPLDISRAFEQTSHMTISSTLKFTNTLPYAWKYHRIDSTELIKKGVSTGSTQQRSTWVQYFRTKTLQVRSDSTENKLNPIQFLIYYNVQFA